MSAVKMQNGVEGAVPQYPIESVDNALRLLLLIGQEGDVRLTDVARHLGVATSTAHRLLAMLMYRRFVRRDPTTKMFTHGPAIVGLSIVASGRLDLRRAARPIMEKLCARFDETVTLGVLEDDLLLFLDAVECRQAVRVASRAGRVLPAHCTALGKALLAYLSPAELRRRYPKQALKQETPHSLGRRSQLEAELETIRQDGYAINREESELGVSSVAVAVTLGLGLPVGGLNISAPKFRFDGSRMSQFAAGLQEGAAEIVQRWI